MAHQYAVMMNQLGAEGQAKYEFADVENLPILKGLPDPFLMPDVTMKWSGEQTLNSNGREISFEGASLFGWLAIFPYRV
jgi:hypothetical protein